MASSRKFAPEDLAEHVARSLSARVRPGGRLTVALSGGADSVALLHVLVGLGGRLGCALSAFHVNHGLSPRADAWEAFCRRLCGALGVAFAACRVTVEPRGGLGLEAAAREARYRAFLERDTDYLALAHHRDDQAETLLLQLLRGAGPRGAAGMASERALRGSGVTLLRPLLEIPRATIIAYARAHALEWVEDETNVDPTRARAFVRHHWLPMAARRFPGADAALARAARLQGEAAALLEDLAAIDGSGGAMAPGRLELARLLGLAPPRARNLLRHFLGRHGLPAPSERRLGEFLRQVRTAAPDGRVRLDLPGWQLHAWRAGVWLVPAVDAAQPILWRGEAALELGAGRGRLAFRDAVGEGIGAEHAHAGGLTVGWRVGGERLQQRRGGPRYRLKKLLQERGIPPWMRGRLPLVYVGSELAWVAGVGFSEAAAAGSGEPGWVPEWTPEPGYGADGRPLAW